MASASGHASNLQGETRHMGTLWALSPGETVPAPVAPHVPAMLQRVRAEDAEALQALAAAMGLTDAAPVRARLAAGKHCFIARVDEAVAAYGWVSFEEEVIGEIGLSLRLPPGDAYIWDCATLPAYRGRRLYPALLSVMIAALRVEGRRRIWIGAAHENVASQHGMRLAGFHPVVDLLAQGGQLSLQPYANVPEQEAEAARRMLFGKEQG